MSAEAVVSPVGMRRGVGGLIKVVRDVVYVSIGKYGQYLVTAVTLPLMARVLDPAGLGLLAVGMSSYFFGSLIADLGLTAFVAARVHDAEVDQLRGNYLAIRLAVVWLLACALAAATAADLEAHVRIVVFGLFAGSVSALPEDWLLIGHGRFGANMATQSVGRVLYLVLVAVLLPGHPYPDVVLACLLWSSLISVMASWIYSTYRFGLPDRPHRIRELIWMGAPVFLGRILITGYGQGAAAIYSGVLNAASLGLFSAGDRVVRAVQSLLDPIGLALLPRMASKDRADRFWPQAVRGVAVCLGLGSAAAGAIWIVAPYIVRIVFGGNYSAAAGLLRMEGLILPATAVTSFVSTAVLSVRKDTRGVLIGAAVGTGVSATALAASLRTHSVWTMLYGLLAAEVLAASWYLVRMFMLSRIPARPIGDPFVDDTDCPTIELPEVTRVAPMPAPRPRTAAQRPDWEDDTVILVPPRGFW